MWLTELVGRVLEHPVSKAIIAVAMVAFLIMICSFGGLLNDRSSYRTGSGSRFQRSAKIRFCPLNRRRENNEKNNPSLPVVNELRAKPLSTLNGIPGESSVRGAEELIYFEFY